MQFGRILVLCVAMVGCKSSGGEGASGLRESAIDPAAVTTAAMTESFRQACEGAATDAIVKRIYQGILMGSATRATRENPGQNGDNINISSGTCAFKWDRFVKNPSIDLFGLSDFGPLVAMVETVEDLQLLITVKTVLPKSFASITQLAVEDLVMVGEDGVSYPDAVRAEILDVASRFPELRKLMLSKLGLKNLTKLSGLTKLVELDVGGNEIVDLGFMSGFGSLRAFRANANAIEDLGPLGNCIELEAIEVGKNRIKNLEPLMIVANLRSLILSENTQMESLLSLQFLPNLRRLSLAAAGIKNIEALKSLALEYLDLTSNPVATIEPLRKMPLTQLFLRGTAVFDLAPIADMKALWKLSLNQAPNVKVFPPMPEDLVIQVLDLQGTKITDLCPAVRLPKLSALKTPGGGMVTGNALSTLKTQCQGPG